MSNSYAYEIMTRNSADTANMLTYVPIPTGGRYGMIGLNPLSSPNANTPIFYALGNMLSFNTGTSAFDFNPAGTASQFVDGTGALQTSKTALSQFTNDAGFISSVPAQSWSSITSKPTTLSGYG